MKAIVGRTIFTVAVTLALLASLVACGGNASNAGDDGANPSGEDAKDTGGTSSPVSPPTGTDSETPTDPDPPTGTDSETPINPEPPPQSGGEAPTDPEPPPKLITASEARAILQDWLDGHPIAPPDTLSSEYSERDVDGEAYYSFSLDNMEMYWANFLVNKETGELLFMMVSDGEEPDIQTQPLGDWYDEFYGYG